MTTTVLFVLAHAVLGLSAGRPAWPWVLATEPGAGWAELDGDLTVFVLLLALAATHAVLAIRGRVSSGPG